MGLIVFDVDGTIFKDNDTATEAFADTVYELYGITDYSTQWHSYRICSDIGIIREICSTYLKHKMDWSEIVRFENLYFEKVSKLLKQNPSSLVPVKGFCEFIRKCKSDSRLRVAIYTGGMNKVSLLKLAQIGIYETEFPIATAQDGLNRRDIYWSAVNKARVMYNIETIGTSIIVGDSKLDINLSKELKIPLVGVTTSISTHEFNECGVWYTIKDYSNIEGLMEDMIYLFGNE